MPENGDLKMRELPVTILDPARFISALIRNILPIITAALFLAVLLAAKCAYTEKPKYKASFNIQVSNKTADTEVNSVTTTDVAASGQLAVQYVQAIKTNQPFLETVIGAAGMADSVGFQKLKGYVAAEQSASSAQTVQVTITSSNAEECLRLAEAMAAVIPYTMPEIIKGSSVNVTSKPSQAFSRTTADVKGNAKKGALAGLAAACVLVILLEVLDRKVKSAKEISSAFTDAEVSVIPTAKAAVPGSSEKDRAFTEAFRTLRSIIRSGAGEDGTCSVIGITSAEKQAGRTLVAQGLAEAYAGLGKKCLYVDADLRHTAANHPSDGKAEMGLADVISGRSAWKQAVTASERGFDILPAGEYPEDPTRILDSAKMRTLIESARDDYEVILLDLPPVIGCSDVMIVSGCLDEYIFVVRNAQSDICRVREAAEMVGKTGKGIRCFVFNDAGAVKL